MQIINGKVISEKRKQALRERLSKNGQKLMFVVISVGNDPASEVYIKNKQTAAKEVGIDCQIVHFEETASPQSVLQTISLFNKIDTVNGILVQLPLPKGFDEDKIIDAIAPEKDIDCLTDKNFAMLSSGSRLMPCTAKGVMNILKEIGLNPSGKTACIIGRNKLAGRSIEMLLNAAGATTILCHSKTPDISKFVQQADIVVPCVGKPSLINADMLKEGAVVIDVGISRTPEGLKGDFDATGHENKKGFFTPVPGGTGPMTVVSVLENTEILADLQKNKNAEKEIEK